MECLTHSPAFNCAKMAWVAGLGSTGVPSAQVAALVGAEASGGWASSAGTCGLSDSSHRVASQPLLSGVNKEKGEDELGEENSALPQA